MGLEGYILLSRSIIDSAVFKNEKWLKVWVWCLLEAGFKDRVKQVKTGKGMSVVHIERGQFVFGRNKHAKDLDIPPSTLWKIMLKLENLGNLNIQRNTHYSIVTVCNYDTYQDSENYSGTGKGTGKEQARNRQGTHLNKERKKESKNKYSYSNEFEKCWQIYPLRNGIRQGKQPSSILFEKLTIDDKRKIYKGILGYIEYLKKADHNPMDLKRFINDRMFDDYQTRQKQTRVIKKDEIIFED